MNFSRSENGSVAISAAILLPLVLAAGGGALDYANAIETRIDVQNALDAATLGVAYHTGDKAAREAAGRAMFSTNANGVCDAEPVFDITEDGIEADVTCGVKTVILTIISIDKIDVTAHTEIGFASSGAIASPTVDACVYALKEKGTGFDWGSGGLTASDCNIQVNSSGRSALARGAGMATVKAFNVVGGINHDCYPDRCSVAPNTGAPALPDPMADFAPPATPDPCDFTKFTAGEGVYTISPGVYCNGLRTEEDVTLEPGLYVIRGGVVDRSTENWVGEGVTFRLEDGARIDTSAGDTTITAPTSGPYRGIAIYAPSDSTGVIDFSAGKVDIEGAVYAPGYHLDYSAGGGTLQSHWTLLILKSMQTSAGHVVIKSDYDHPDAVPLPAVYDTPATLRIPFIAR